MSTALLCLATAVYFEARGEDHMGQMAVAQVVVNRMEDPRYPNTICDVVWEDRAFSFTHGEHGVRQPPVDGRADTMRHPESRSKAIDVAKSTLDGVGIGITSTHYHTTDVDPFWNNHYDLDGQVGNHIFYTNNTKYK